MFTAKTLPDGTLMTTHHVPVRVVNEETGEVTMVQPVAPEGETVIPEIPSDEVSLHFRDCWELGPQGIQVNLAKAKAKRVALIVQLVDAKLAEIDTKTTRAIRDAILTGDQTRVTELEQQATALRTLRSNTGVDSLAGVEEVAAYLPEILKS